MMDTYVQWATILSPVVAVLIAAWMAHKSAKDTAKQIAALEESTNKQIESMKKLAIIQTKLAALQLEKDTWEARHRWRQLSEENFKAFEDACRTIGFPSHEIREMERRKNERAQHLSLEKEFYSKQISSLGGLQKRLNDIMNEIEEE